MIKHPDCDPSDDRQGDIRKYNHLKFEVYYNAVNFLHNNHPIISQWGGGSTALSHVCQCTGAWLAVISYRFDTKLQLTPQVIIFAANKTVATSMI